MHHWILMVGCSWADSPAIPAPVQTETPLVVKDSYVGPNTPLISLDFLKIGHAQCVSTRYIVSIREQTYVAIALFGCGHPPA